MARLHPFTAMIWTLAMVIMAFVSLNLWASLTLVGLQLGVALVGRLPIRQLSLVLLLVLPLAFFITVIQAVTRGGEALVTVGGIAFSQEGIVLGLAITLRVVNLALAMTNFFASVHPVRLAIALTRLKMPFKYAYTTVLALRFLPLVTGELRNIQNAQKARGYDIEQKNLLVRGFKIMPLMAPLVVVSLRRASNIALAMDLRAFGAHPTRTWFEELRSPGGADYAVWGLAGAALLAYLLLASAL